MRQNRITRVLGDANLTLAAFAIITQISVALGCVAPGDTPAPAPVGTTEEPPLFWLEPGKKTLVGSGQSFNVFVAHKNTTADLFQTYIDPTLVTWSSSNAGVVSISSSGIATGLIAGTATISAGYLEHSSQLEVQVRGTMVKRTVSVPGQPNRNYYIYSPVFVGAPTNHALMLSLHGGGGSAMEQAAKTLMNKTADEQQFFVAYLEGSGAIQTFNAGACCGYAQTHAVDDVLYTRKVLDDIEAHFAINAQAIYATGFSNGGLMSHRLACELADRIAGVAPVSGASGEFDYTLARYYTCSPSRPIPVLHIHAMNDRNYPFAGGTGQGSSSTNFYPVQSTIQDWIVRNNVTSQATVETLGSTTKCYHYRVKANANFASAPVSLCVVDPIDIYDSVNEIVFGGGHAWPGGVRSIGANSDVPSMDFSASNYIWQYLTK